MQYPPSYSSRRKKKSTENVCYNVFQLKHKTIIIIRKRREKNARVTQQKNAQNENLPIASRVKIECVLCSVHEVK